MKAHTFAGWGWCVVTVAQHYQGLLTIHDTTLLHNDAMAGMKWWIIPELMCKPYIVLTFNWLSLYVQNYFAFVILIYVFDTDMTQEAEMLTLGRQGNAHHLRWEPGVECVWRFKTSPFYHIQENLVGCSTTISIITHEKGLIPYLQLTNWCNYF